MTAALDDMVAGGDPDRYRAALAASDTDRAALMVLYAFNLEIARAPYLTEEPLIARMRLQFWEDVLDGIAAGGTPPAHEVASPLAEICCARALPLEAARAMVAARGWDIEREPFADTRALVAHLEASSGSLMWLAARALGAPEETAPVVHAMGLATGVANWLVAVPALQVAGRKPLVDGSDAGIRALARLGQEHLARARAARAQVPARAAPALLAGWQTGGILARAVQAPGRVRDGALLSSEFRRRGALMLRALSGRW